jgi:hypothetical protein
MGCDIHCYIQSKTDYDYVQGFGGRINPGRNYIMFGLMADVRYDSNYNRKPRGMPDRVSWQILVDYMKYIDETESDDNVSREVAQRWVSYGSKLHIDYNTTTDDIKEAKWVTNPDWHSHSYLSTEEFEDCINGYESGSEYKLDDRYYAILAAMKALGPTAQLVFWFDN